MKRAESTEKIIVREGSQGDTLSFAAAALDKRVKVAAPSIPGFSDYRNWFHIVNWSRSDFEYYIQHKMESRDMTSNNAQQNAKAQVEAIYDVLSYFDIKNFAQWIECPLIMGIGMLDEVCPPHINFAPIIRLNPKNGEIGNGRVIYCTGIFFFLTKLIFTSSIN